MSTSHEILVVGAGPAGALAAYLLAREGRSVGLLDRRVFPRPKVCGDCLNPRAQALWESVGLWNEFQNLPQQIVRQMEIARDGQLIYRQALDNESFRAVARPLLDQWLVQKAVEAGAEFLSETTVLQIEPSTGTLQTSRGEFRAQLVLGADGRNSSLAKGAGLLKPSRPCGRIGWQTTLTLPQDSDAVRMNVFAGGYYGLVKIDPIQSNLCFVVESKFHRHPEPLFAQLFPGQTAGAWHSIHPINRPAAGLIRDRLWLMGDAARVVEPFTGEGITFALASAVQAARSWLNSGENTRRSALYLAAHRALYRHELWVNRLTGWLLAKSSRGYAILPWLENFPRFLRYATQRVLLAPPLHSSL